VDDDELKHSTREGLGTFRQGVLSYRLTASRSKVKTVRRYWRFCGNLNFVKGVPVTYKG
jgi:hypothetical protein